MKDHGTNEMKVYIFQDGIGGENDGGCPLKSGWQQPDLGV